MSKHLFFIHGRGFKPCEPALKELWFDAIEHGLRRDCSQLVTTYQDLKRTFVYYGDISNRFLSGCRRNREDPYDESKDLNDRKGCLDRLKAYRRDQFLKNEGRRTYRDLEGYAPWKETLVDLLGGFADAIGLAGRPALRTIAPDIDQYWEPDSSFGSEVRCALTIKLEKALCENDDVMLVAHSLGSMIAYDVLWKS